MHTVSYKRQHPLAHFNCVKFTADYLL